MVNAGQAAYISALQGAGEAGDDIVGYVFAINGKVNGGDVYPSNALFRKMWTKMLAANVTDAIVKKVATEPRRRRSKMSRASLPRSTPEIRAYAERERPTCHPRRQQLAERRGPTSRWQLGAPGLSCQVMR